jgi:ABC-2 type transport system ATP-binding protein
VIVCTGIAKSYGSLTVLDGIDLIIDSGICALLGVNGAGKSTLLRLLSGIEKPDGGLVLIHGMNFRDQAVEIRRDLGVLPEGLALFESLSVIENLMAVGPIYGLSQREAKARSESLLKLLDIAQARHTPARKCSFGTRKKTALAMALIHKPRVLLLDEPFEGIDPASSRGIQSLLLQLSGQGTTILLTSHILSIVQTVADRVVILRRGHIESDFAPDADEAVEDRYLGVVGGLLPEVPDWLKS